MNRLDHSQVHEILHDYRKECYRLQHAPDAHEAVAREQKRIVEEILQANHHFVFHKPVNAAQAEIFTMIEDYTREAVLPPVLNRLVERLVVLEKRQEAGIRCLERLIHLIENTGG